MKTNLFIAALSLVVLAGCSSEDEIDTLVSKSDNAITFGTYVGKQTKAIEKSAFAENDQFGVFAFYTKAEGYNNTKDTPNFMYEQSIKKGAGEAEWTYSPVKYWPNTNGEQITFFAYYPHALSKVNIKAQMKETLNSETTVNIKSIALNNIYNTNTLKYTGSTPSWGWDTASNGQKYEITPTNISLASDGTTAIDITSFLMVPQTLSTEDGKKASITITYDVVTTDTSLPEGSSTITNTITTDITSTTEWKMNQQYVYTIQISLTDVSVSTEVSGWTEPTE